MLALVNEPLRRQAVNFLKCALILVLSVLSILRAFDKHEPSLTESGSEQKLT